LGLTATPDRKTQAPLKTVYGPNGLWYQRLPEYFYENLNPDTGCPYLAKPQFFPININGVETEGLKLNHLTGDYDEKDLLALLSSSDLGYLIADRLQSHLRISDNDAVQAYKKTLVFVSGIQDVKTSSAVLRQRGIMAGYIHSQMSVNEIQKLIKALNGMGAQIPRLQTRDVEEARDHLEACYDRGLFPVMVNDGIYEYGKDDPEILAVIYGRACGSRSKYIRRRAV